MTSPSDKADLEILFNALLAAKMSVEAALREARLLVGMPEPPSTTEPLIAKNVLLVVYDDLAKRGFKDALRPVRIVAKELYGITLDGDGNG